MTKHEADVLIVGSGIAGLFTALKLAADHQVLLITKEGIKDTATHYAQGGMASPVGGEASIQSHIQDTLIAGAGLCDATVVQTIITEAPERLKELIALGVSFSKENGAYHLTREGGHSDSRVFHHKDITGKEIQRALTERVLNSKNIFLLEHHMAVDLIVSHNRCYGSYVFDMETQSVKTLKTNATVLASGGAGKVYLYTSNPDVATGDGIAMAARRGALIANMEFFQFHPTCLYHPQAKSFLMTEALRGEGAKLVDGEGRAFMSSYDGRAELAPRDIVARANIIKRTLANFGTEVEMGEVNVGPTVTQFTLKPAEGIKLSRITALHNDLALALAAHPLRIEAPIPGRALVGIEVPNKGIATVRARNILENEGFKKAASALTLGLGKDVTGVPVYANLGKMPHLLIAGSTGSGKTIALNMVIVSLLYCV